VGDDAFGPQLRQALEDAGVDGGCLETVPGSSGLALITTGRRGENNIVVVPGANGMLTPRQLERAIPVIEQAGFLLTQLEIPLETVEYLAALAERYGIPLMLDPAPARELPASVLRKVTWITPNEPETRALLKSTLNTENDSEIFAAADQLLASGVQNALLKLGARGCVIAQAGQAKKHVPAFSVNAVDTTAAGDAFNAAFAVGLMGGQAAEPSAVFASAAAAISVTRAGAQPSMPTDHEVKEFLERRGPVAIE
jgi:ribokinase